MNPYNLPPDTSAPQVSAALDHGTTPAADSGTGITARWFRTA